MKAIKTKSGKWQCRPVDHYEKDENGKRRVVLACITRDTKDECLEAGYAYKRSHEVYEKKAPPLTFSVALQKYIDLKSPVLSPTTLRGYYTLKNNAYDLINDLPISDITSVILQTWISSYSSGRTPKSVRNAYGLAMSVISMFRPGIRFDVRLPAKRPPQLYTPTDADIKLLLDHCSGTELEKAVLLAALGTLRRGEVCALTYDDISGDAVTVNKSMVKDRNNKWIVKAPKTPESFRTVVLPHSAIERILRDPDPSGRIITTNPWKMTDNFVRALDECGLPRFRFHDLRAYAASVRHAIGVPDQYIMQDGGWKSDLVLKQIYRRTMADKQEEFTNKINTHFSDMLGS